MFFSKKYKYFLSVVAIFKNESHAIREWVEHYINQGVDHFFMIDNGSTDNTTQKIKEYVDKGLISLITDSTKWAQIELYNKHYLKKCKSSEWVIVCDLDEFIYARNGFSKISDYLKARKSETGLIRVPWKMFGSSGHVTQPEKIIHGFINRSLYDGEVKPGTDMPGYSTSKIIVRSKALKKIDIHTARIKKSYLTEDSAGRVPNLSDPHFQPISEQLLKESHLHLNHYAIQSKNWFLEVKCTRGDVNGSVHETFRNQEYFDRYDALSNEIKDEELALKSIKNTVK